MRSEMQKTECAELTDAELADINGGDKVLSAYGVIYGGAFGLGALIGNGWGPDFGVQVPSSPSALYASWR
jgi:hypothetical protein